MSNLKHAKIVLAFSWMNDDGSSIEHDKRIAFIASEIKAKYNKLRIVLVLNSNITNLLEKDSLYKDI